MGVAIAVPHLLALDDASPSLSVKLWASALLLRAVASITAGLVVLLGFAHSPLLDPLTHWCVSAVVREVPDQLDVDGHLLGHAVSILPTLLVAGSALVALLGLMRTARAVRHAVTASTIGPGPGASLIVGGEQVVLASAGFARPQVLVSAGALLVLDDDELAAGLAHEHGHVARKHRFWLFTGAACAGLARFLPGTRSAHSQLVFHVERDADRWALAQEHNPLALAGAICKAARCSLSAPSALGLDGANVAERVSQLLAPPRAHTSRRNRALSTVAGALLVSALSLSALLPTTAAAGMARLAERHAGHHCVR